MRHKRPLFFGVLILAAALSYGALQTQASHIAYDPYADAVQGHSGTGVTDPDRAVGAPDGQTTNFVGFNKFLTLDMGAGEEGTKSLRVYFGSLIVKSDIQVIFFDESLREIASEQSPLTAVVGQSSQTFNYDFDTYKVAYRYVRLISRADAGFTIDAIEALGYIGSSDTVDTDHGGVPDRTEQHSGTDPQDPADDQTPGDSGEPVCGDNNCVSPETSQSCPADCGAPAPVCGNGLCTSPETSQTCPADCGAPPVCGDNRCVNPETPQTCARDCATSAPVCGDGRCVSPETSQTCAADCGAPPFCGDGQCVNPETPQNCAVDCTATPPSTPPPSTPPAPAPTPKPSTPPAGASADTKAPVISDVRSVQVDSSTQKIFWTTNEPATSQVEYQADGGELKSTPVDEALTTEHEVTLTGLTPATGHTYRVYSRDAAVNVGISLDYRFTTMAEKGAAAPAGGDRIDKLIAAFGGCRGAFLGMLLLLLLLILSLLGNAYLMKRLRKEARAREKEHERGDAVLERKAEIRK